MDNQWLKNGLHLWEVDDGEQHWYSASSEEDALEQHLKPMLDPKTGENMCFDQDEIDEIEVSQVPDNQPVHVKMENNSLVSKSAKMWCADGRGFIASTIY